MTQSSALAYFMENSGYARMKDLKSRGIHPRVLRSFLSKGIVRKIKPGIYKLESFHNYPNQDYVDLCIAMKKGVICLGSALHYYGLSDSYPEKPMIAVPQGYRKPRVSWPEYQSFFFSGHMYQSDILELDRDEGSFRIYSREKSIVDAFRFRNRLGVDLAREALHRYVSQSQHRHLGKLLMLAKKCRMYNIMLPYLDS